MINDHAVHLFVSELSGSQVRAIEDMIANPKTSEGKRQVRYLTQKECFVVDFVG